MVAEWQSFTIDEGHVSDAGAALQVAQGLHVSAARAWPGACSLVRLVTCSQ